MSICIHPNPSHNLLSTGPLQWPTYWSIHISFSPHYHSTGSSQNEFLQRKLDYVILFLEVFNGFPFLGGSMEKFLNTVSSTWRVWLILFSLFPLSTCRHTSLFSVLQMHWHMLSSLPGMLFKSSPTFILENVTHLILDTISSPGMPFPVGQAHYLCQPLQGQSVSHFTPT